MTDPGKTNLGSFWKVVPKPRPNYREFITSVNVRSSMERLNRQRLSPGEDIQAKLHLLGYPYNEKHPFSAKETC